MEWPAAGRNPAITLDLDHVPFWTAVHALCDATHTRPQFIGRPGEISLMQGNAGAWDQEGRFAFLPIIIQHDHQVDLVNGGATRNDSIMLTVFVDPKIHSVGADPPHITVAEDELGNSLIGNNQAQNVFFNPGYQQQWCLNISAPLAFPPGVGKTLARFEGTVPIRFPTSVTTLKIPDLAKAVGTATIAGKHKVDVIAFNSVSNNIVQVHFSVSRLTRAGSMPGGLFQEFQGARATDAAGQLLMLAGGGGGTDIQIDWQGQFNGARPIKLPISLQWEITDRVETVNVPFKFKTSPCRRSDPFPC